MGEFVANDSANVAVVDGDVLGAIEEGRLQDSSGEVDVVHAGVVVGVDGGRGHIPLAVVDRLANFVELAVVLELVGAELIAERLVGPNGELGVVAPLVGIADFVGDRGELLFGFDFGFGRHPVDRHRCRAPWRLRCRGPSGALWPCCRPRSTGRRRPCPELRRGLR